MVRPIKAALVNFRWTKGKSTKMDPISALEAVWNRLAKIHSLIMVMVEDRVVAVTENNQYSFSSTSSPFPNGSSTDHLATVREGLLAGIRSPSSGFEEESIGSLTSDCDVQMKGETIGTRYFVSQRIPCRESVDSGFLQADSPCEFINRSLQFYGTTAPSPFMPPPPAFPANFIRQFWPSASPMPQSQPMMWYCREYNLFNGPSFEELFRREMPNLYNGTGRRFEPTNTNYDQYAATGGFIFAERAASI